MKFLLCRRAKKGNVGLAERFLIQTETRILAAPSRILLITKMIYSNSPTHGKMVWDGIVKDNAIEATSIWTRERWYWKIKKEYWFRGQMKK